MSKLDRLAELSRRRAAYQPVGLSVAAEPGVYSNAQALMVSVARIRPNPRNPRKTFSAEALDELADSIRAKGILNPITVRRSGDHYVIVAGDRRYRAALQVGLEAVPCIVRDLTEDDAYVESLIENLQREDLAPEEEAAALQYLVVERGLGVREIARLIHKSPAYVSTKVRVAQDPELVEAVRGGLPISAAERLLAVDDPERRRAIIAGFQRGEYKTQDLPRLLRPRPPTPLRPAPPEPAGPATEELDRTERAIGAAPDEGGEPVGAEPALGAGPEAALERAAAREVAPAAEPPRAEPAARPGLFDREARTAARRFGPELDAPAAPALQKVFDNQTLAAAGLGHPTATEVALGTPLAGPGEPVGPGRERGAAPADDVVEARTLEQLLADFVLASARWRAAVEQRLAAGEQLSPWARARLETELRAWRRALSGER